MTTGAILEHAVFLLLWLLLALYFARRGERDRMLAALLIAGNWVMRFMGRSSGQPAWYWLGLLLLIGAVVLFLRARRSGRVRGPAA